MSVPVGESFVGPSVNPKNGAGHQLVRSSFYIPQQSNFVYPVAKVLQGGTVGVSYSETMTALGGLAPFSFSVIAGALPPALSLNATTGVISGSPTTIGTYNFTIQVTDANGDTGSEDFFITILTPSSGGAAGNYGVFH